MFLWCTVGPCSLDYTKLHLSDQFWSDPPADELLQRQRVHASKAHPPFGPAMSCSYYYMACQGGLAGSPARRRPSLQVIPYSPSPLFPSPLVLCPLFPFSLVLLALLLINKRSVAEHLPVELHALYRHSLVTYRQDHILLIVKITFCNGFVNIHLTFKTLTVRIYLFLVHFTCPTTFPILFRICFFNICTIIFISY